MSTSTAVYLGLGSNLGERAANLNEAVRRLSARADLTVVRVAEFLETEPVGCTPQSDYVNSAVEIATELPPEDLLAAVKGIEREMGRDTSGDWGPRTIDIDVLFYGNRVLVTDTLVIPHPMVCERIFVLKPMISLAPDLVHPVFRKTLGQIYEQRRKELSLYHYMEL